jgi:hypothetical protein
MDYFGILKWKTMYNFGLRYMLVHATDYCNGDLNPYNNNFAQWDDVS